jgi:hypothetical protein
MRRKRKTGRVEAILRSLFILVGGEHDALPFRNRGELGPRNYYVYMNFPLVYERDTR